MCKGGVCDDDFLMIYHTFPPPKGGRGVAVLTSPRLLAHYLRPLDKEEQMVAMMVMVVVL